MIGIFQNRKKKKKGRVRTMTPKMWLAGFSGFYIHVHIATQKLVARGGDEGGGYTFEQ